MDQMQAVGWYLDKVKVDEHGLQCSAKDTSSVLNVDLKEIGASFVDAALFNKKVDELQGPMVFQVQKIRNVLIPKVKEDLLNRDGAKLLRIILTDGHNACNALDIEGTVPGLGMNTPPGTKLLLKNNIQYEKGFLLLTNKNTQVLGGNVDHLVERWKMDRADVYEGARRRTGAPPWVPFGRKINESKGDFKALAKGPAGSAEDAEEISEFEQTRQETIERLQGKEENVAAKKFGGAKPVIDLPVRGVDPPAESALKKAPIEKSTKPPKKNKFRDDDLDYDNGPQSTVPEYNTSLFDFVQTKIKPDASRNNEPSESKHESASARGYDVSEDFNRMDMRDDQYQPRGQFRGRGRGGDRGGRGPRRGRGGGRGSGYDRYDSQTDQPSRDYGSRGGRQQSHTYRQEQFPGLGADFPALGEEARRKPPTSGTVSAREYTLGREEPQFRTRGGARPPVAESNSRGRPTNRPPPPQNQTTNRPSPAQNHTTNRPPPPQNRTTASYQPRPQSKPGPVFNPGEMALSRHPEDGRVYQVIIEDCAEGYAVVSFIDFAQTVRVPVHFLMPYIY